MRRGQAITAQSSSTAPSITSKCSSWVPFSERRRRVVMNWHRLKDKSIRDSSFGDEWEFHYYVFPRKQTEGHGGYAEVHRRGDFCCKLLLAKSRPSRAVLLTKLQEKCVAWVADLQSRNGG